MKKKFETTILLAAAVGFLGFVYPELCLIDDTIVITKEQEAGTDRQDEKELPERINGSANAEKPDRTGGSVNEEKQDRLELICNLPSDQIRLRSRFLAYLDKMEEKE